MAELKRLGGFSRFLIRRVRVASRFVLLSRLPFATSNSFVEMEMLCRVRTARTLRRRSDGATVMRGPSACFARNRVGEVSMNRSGHMRSLGHPGHSRKTSVNSQLLTTTLTE